VVGALIMLESTTILCVKVGQHGSHNATLEDGGLEAMTSPRLVAAIPVDESFARNTKHWDMPGGPLLTALQRKTSINSGRPPSPLTATRRPSLRWWRLVLTLVGSRMPCGGVPHMPRWTTLR